MYVNPFWFGFLLAIVVMIVLTMILAYINGKLKDEEEYQPTEEEVREALEEITGKKFRIVNKNGYLVDEIIEEEGENGEKDQ